MKKTILWGFSVDDVGLDGYSTEKHLNNILDFLDANTIKATFFAVPEAEGKKMSSRRAYVAILRDAIKRGHEVAQHGLTHDRFEIGIPPEMIMMLPHEGPARKYLAENREKLAQEHTVEKIRCKLRKGREIIEDAIGRPVHGFRAPALQSCDNMFIALAEEKYRYDSSTCLQPAAWDILNNIKYVPREINREAFLKHQKNGLCELSHTAEYTWYLGRGRFDEFYALAVHDFDSCLKSGLPFINAGHVSPIQEGADGNLGFEFYRKFISYAKTSAEKGGYVLKSTTLYNVAKCVSEQ
ncbi:MAG: polysaccharide deacetylase family protein [Kiritimatiellia bacterium]